MTIAQIKFISSCFDKSGKLINDNLALLLNLTNINHNGEISSICDNVFVQEKGWLRIGDRNSKQTDRFDKDAAEIFYLARNLGFIEAIDEAVINKDIIYDAAIIHGSRAIQRFSAILQESRRGVKFKQIIVMTTSEVVYQNFQAQEAGFAPTELGYMQYVYNQLLKENLSTKEIEIKWLDTPNKNSDRPHTKDTIYQLVKDVNLKNMQNIIAVSNQPFIQYQNKLVEIILAVSEYPNIKIFSLGNEEQNPKTPILLDSIARTIKLEAILRATKNGDFTQINNY